MYAKRFWLALVFGTVAGVICGWGGYDNTPEDIRMLTFVSALLNRMFIGFVIGISAWKMQWALHGVVMGFLGSLPLALPLIWTGEGGFAVAGIYILAGIVWGLLIELGTSVIFKARQQ